MPIKIDYKKCCYRDGACQECKCKKAKDAELRSKAKGKSECNGCAEACPTGALVRGKNLIEYNKKLCIDCGACIPACKYDAIKLI
jgi:Fe-S-cluster-containing hydrogenase component 2